MLFLFFIISLMQSANGQQLLNITSNDSTDIVPLTSMYTSL